MKVYIMIELLNGQNGKAIIVCSTIVILGTLIVASYAIHDRYEFSLTRGNISFNLLQNIKK